MGLVVGVAVCSRLTVQVWDRENDMVGVMLESVRLPDQGQGGAIDNWVGGKELLQLIPLLSGNVEEWSSVKKKYRI